MTLDQIRKADSFESLKPAMRYLCDNMQAMPWGDFQAYKRTLESQCAKLGIELTQMNQYADQYQIYGEA